MRKLRFDWLMLILSIIFSALPAGILGLIVDADVLEDAVSRFFLGALFFTLPLMGSLFAITIVEMFRKKNYILQTKGNRIISFIVALVLGGLLGGGGQIMYMIGIEEEEIEVEKSTETMDVSVLIDYSKGMESYTDDCEKAVCDFIDGADEDTNIQIMSFASIVFECSELTQATDTNKNSLKDAVISFDHTGGTNFDAPLIQATDTLTSTGGSDKKAILIVSDGDCKVDASIEKQLKKEDIAVHFINVKKGSSKIDSLVSSTNGKIFDMSDSSFDASELCSELKNEDVDMPEPDKHLAIVDGVIYDSDDEISFYKFLIRFAVFVIYILLASFVMYYSISLASFVSAVITGLIVALLTLTGVDFIAHTAYILAFWAAFTKYYPLNGGGYVV